MHAEEDLLSTRLPAIATCVHLSPAGLGHGANPTQRWRPGHTIIAMWLRTGLVLAAAATLTAGCGALDSGDPVPADEAQAACQQRVESEYEAEQRPAVFGPVKVDRVDAVQIVTGSVEGNTSQPATFFFTCATTADGETRLVSFAY